MERSAHDERNTANKVFFFFLKNHLQNSDTRKARVGFSSCHGKGVATVKTRGLERALTFSVPIVESLWANVSRCRENISNHCAEERG